MMSNPNKLMASDTVPPHAFHDGTTSDSCFICTKPQDHPIHDGFDEEYPNFVDSLVDNLPREDYNTEESSDVTEPGQDGVMVALFIDPEVAEELSNLVPGGEPASNMHVTLVYLGKAVDLSNPEDLISTVAQFAKEEGAPISGTVGGFGLFTGGELPVTYASVDAPSLPAFRQALTQVLDAAGFAIDTLHGFTPHITLVFDDARSVDVPNLPLTFNTITVAIAGVRTTFPLGNPETSGEHKKHEYQHPVVDPNGNLSESFPGFPMGAYPPCKECGLDKDHPDHIGPEVDFPEQKPVTSGYLQVVERKPVVITNTPEKQTAFVSDVNGHTLITGPASVNVWEKALNPNPHMMWIQGRLVGADEPNRNKAFWSTQDLELGEATVTNGPLNWLHESRHIIGSIADHRIIRPSEGASVGGQLGQTHIAAMAGVWQWIYPDEAWVIENSSDQGKLWYSMECVSENVECVGDGGCGTKVSYNNYLKGEGACQHMIERSGVRRFENPTFLGAAVIVPPVRPGWADADARVLREASSMAEVAFEQVKPDMTASEWEALMRQVVGYAHTL